MAALLAIAARSPSARRERSGDAGLDLGGGALRGDAGLRRASLPGLPRERTFFLCLDTLGSPHLLVLRGEGMIGCASTRPRSLALLDGLAEELGIWLFPNLRLRNATDGGHPARRGLSCASLCSCTDLKQPANYHWPTDVPENVDYGTVARKRRPR